MHDTQKTGNMAYRQLCILNKVDMAVRDENSPNAHFALS